MRVRVSGVVRARADRLGPPGWAWLAGLDAQVAALGERWGLTGLEQLAGGTAAVVLRGQDAAGRAVVLKLAVPDDGFALQAGTLERAAGRGYARLLAVDDARRALLLEGLGPPLDRSGLPVEGQLRVLCDVLAEAWSTPPAPGQQPLDKAGELHELVSRWWRELGAPGPERAVRAALACARARADDPPSRWLVVHGDAAPPNCLRVPTPRDGAAAGWAFVDPDGFLGDPAYDLGVALRDWHPRLADGDPATTMRRWLDLVAGRTGLDPTAIGQWAFLERVSTGLLLLTLGEERLGRRFLGTAEALLGSG